MDTSNVLLEPCTKPNWQGSGGRKRAGGRCAEVGVLLTSALQLGGEDNVQPLLQCVCTSMLLIQRHPRLTHDWYCTCGTHVSAESGLLARAHGLAHLYKIPTHNTGYQINTVRDTFSRSCRQMQQTQPKLNALAAYAFLRTKAQSSTHSNKAGTL
jgi:hypothetical protein